MGPYTSSLDMVREHSMSECRPTNSSMRILFITIVITRVAMACSCGPQAYAPLCQRIDKVKVLFIGTAVETNDNHDGFIKGGLWYRFRVDEPFKGLDSGVKEVVVNPASGTSCQEEFTV